MTTHPSQKTTTSLEHNPDQLVNTQRKNCERHTRVPPLRVNLLALLGQGIRAPGGVDKAKVGRGDMCARESGGEDRSSCGRAHRDFLLAWLGYLLAPGCYNGPDREWR